MVFKCFNCQATDNLYAAPHTQEMRERWLELFPEGDLTMFNDSFRICAEHFDNKYILPTGLLSTRAVPTKFLVHNVWCEIEDENGEQENKKDEQQKDPASEDEDNNEYNIASTDSQLLIKSFAVQQNDSIPDTLFLYNNNNTLTKTDVKTSSSHQTSGDDSNSAMNVNQTTIDSNLSQVSFFSHDDTFPAADSKSIQEPERRFSEVSRTNSFKRALQSTPTEIKSESREDYSLKNSTFHSSSPEIEDKKHEPTRKNKQAASTISPPTSKKVKDKYPDIGPTRLSFSSPGKKSITPKSILSSSKKSHNKRVKFHPRIQFAPLTDKVSENHEKERKFSYKNSIKLQKNTANISKHHIDRKSEAIITEIKNEGSYSSKKRKKMPIVLLKRLKFPNNAVPRPGTLFDAEEMGLLNSFKVIRYRQENKIFNNSPNGFLNMNGSVSIACPVVDLTLDDDSDSSEKPQEENRPISRLISPPEINQHENNCQPDTSPRVTHMSPEKPAPVVTDSAFDVREDLPLSEQLKFYNAELKRVQTVQSSLKKQYRTYNDKFTKLQSFLDQLAKSGLIMKRDDK